MLEDFLNIAISQIGYKEGKNNKTKYGAWYGLDNNPWCAMFISWCANKSGILETKIPKYASCTTGFNWFKRKNLISSKPSVGAIGFVMTSSTHAEHTFIVEKFSGNYVYTIEGNLNNKVMRNKRKLSVTLKFANIKYDEYFVVGGYELLYNKALRKDHKIANNIVKIKELPKNSIARKFLTIEEKNQEKLKNQDAYLKEGSKPMIREIYKESNGRIWGRYISYWIVLQNKDKTKQAKKI